MILIAGNDTIVDSLCSAFDSLERPYRRVDKLDAGHAWELHATTVILVEPLPRVGATASASERDLREIMIIVTPRPDADAELRAVRRSGIPYAIVRPLPVVERTSDPDRPVLVARELAGAAAAAVTPDMIVDAVIAALDGGACGQALDLAPPPEMTWTELLARAGVNLKAVAPWRARVGRWFGARTFDASKVSPAPA